MEYIGIGIVIAVAIAVAIAAGIIIYTKFTKCENIPSGDLVSAPSTVTSGKDGLAEIHQENELIIQMEMLPAEAINDETKLVEITDSNPILTRSEVYSGVYGRASISFYAFNSSGNKGIACGLNNLQKIRDGEPLGGKASAESDFASDEDDDFLD